MRVFCKCSVLLSPCSWSCILFKVPEDTCCSDGILLSVPHSVLLCSMDGTLFRLLWCDSDLEIPEYADSMDGTRPCVPEWYCSVGGTLLSDSEAYWCSVDGILDSVPVGYWSTDTVLVSVLLPEDEDEEDEACCWVDGILVRVPKLIAEQLVVRPPNATERRFGL